MERRIPGTRRTRIYAIAVACVLLATWLSFALVGKSTQSASAAGCGDGIGPAAGLQLNPADTQVFRDSFTVSDMELLPTKIDHGAATITVLRVKALRPRVDPNSVSRVVYRERVRMTELTAGACASDWKWSGQFSPSDWAGGCVSGDLYSVDVESGNRRYSVGEQTPWLTCRRTARST